MRRPGTRSAGATQASFMAWVPDESVFPEEYTVPLVPPTSSPSRASAPGRGPASVARQAGAGALAVAWVLSSCSGGQAPVPAFDTVTRGTVRIGVAASGALSAASSKQLGFPQGGKLTSVKVKVGQRVEKGDVLARVDDEAARKALDEAEANVRGQSALLGQDAADPGVQNAAATLAQARHILKETKQEADATYHADSRAIGRAKKERKVAEEALDQAEDVVDAVKKQCDATPDPAAATPSAACAQLSSAKSGVVQAKQGLSAKTTAVVAAEQKRRVDDASGDVAEANAKQSVVAAQNAYNSAVAARPHTLEQQQAQIDAAQAKVDAAQKDLDDTVLRAPSAGTISVVNGTKGEYLSASSGTTALAPGSKAAIPGASTGGSAAAGGPAAVTRPGGSQFIVLSGGGRLQLVLPFEESDASRIKVGQGVDVLLDAVPDLQVRGRVTAVAPSGTPISGVVSYYATVALDRPDRRMRDGQTARAEVVTTERKNVLTVPNAAVRLQGGASSVVVYEPDGDERDVTFQAGLVGPDRTEVISGLSEGDRVVVPGHP